MPERLSAETQPQRPDVMEQVVNLCKRRGFVFPSAEIYGGFRSTYDYGPLGVLMLRNVKDAWWRSMVQLRDDVVGLDAAILGPPAIWEASGHLKNFTDPLVDCRNCKERFRLDKLDDPHTCPNCGAKDSFTEARQFNLMFKTHAGPVENEGAVAYLRPETAQGMFVNFLNVLQTTRKKPPFGIAQVGKSFRNEITPQNFVFRTREFEQMEMEYFVPPGDAQRWYEFWCEERFRWYIDLGIPEDDLRLRAHDPDELSHYSSGTSDVEFRFPWGWDELEGIANRGDYDLTQHATFSGEKLEYFDQASGERYVPHVVEPAAGATRTMMAFLIAAYREDEVNGEARTLLALHPRLAPYKVAVLPLSKKETLTPVAREVLAALQPHWMVDYDETQSIGRRYRRQDEIGTPYCVTVDFESLDDKAVTVRDRDTLAQDRVPIDGLVDHLREKLGI
ncbi:MAG TPA: glycine--tRNA ligase [Acidimicrobiales bacterium]|jgi:glycyl-tRNA synthetase|nr:glycine--tRNA ligase [Acidimicrobiales bacterium]